VTPTADKYSRCAVSPDPKSVRGRLDRALIGEPVEWPVYAVYDWFVKNRPIDWPSLFAQGLGQIIHADLVQVERPHLRIEESVRTVDGKTCRTVRWITDRGELQETYVGEWRKEHFVKNSGDYRILQRAFEDSRYAVTEEPFRRAEAELGDGGITLGVLGWAPLYRTPLPQVQIDFAGQERFAMDLADEIPELMDLLDLLTELILRKFREAVKAPARYIKLWENLAIEMIGVRHYRQRLVPMYRQILDIVGAAGKRLLVHYDGKLRCIADDVARLDFDIDSLTPPPEGDLSVAEARSLWPDKFLWLHPPLGWYREEPETLSQRIRQMIADAGPNRFCLMISEDVPPAWEHTVPLVLRQCSR
jgi:hypothetical protein